MEELNYNSLNTFLLKVKLYVEKVFGKESRYIGMIEDINFRSYLNSFYDNDIPEDDIAYWRNGMERLRSVISTMKEDLRLSTPVVVSRAVNKTISSNRIFIVHGHDDEMKVSVARFLELLDLNPVILHEQPDKGRNVLDKLIDESEEACFAIVLLTPDDVVLEVDKKVTRARQNVVLELGFFIAKSGKNRVTALYKGSDDFELPSDFAGTLYKKYDSGDGWKVELARELKASGVSIDLNKLC